ncbi:MAG: pyruvate dehydrogenase, partial [Flavobacteriaceae bacterium]|nr:pyruvate dehydrogenase [Flavobacteriaceae bacterium]
MAEIINMPRLSDTMEEGTVAKWLKKVGDKIEEGDILAEIETDKATMEFESFHEGTLLHIGIAEGDGAPVDSLLAIIGEEGEDISALLEGGTEKSDSDEKPAEKSDTSQVEDTAQESSSAASSGEIPEGVEVVKMPRLSDTMEEGTVATWLKKVGDDVEEGEILAEIETDKATMEFESFYSGKLLYIGIKEGESAPVDDVLAIIGPDGTDVDAVLNTKSSDRNQTESQPQESDTSDSGSKSADKSESPAPVTRQDGERIFVSPLARKMAEEKGIDLNAVSGSGENGRIVKRDIENFTPASAKTEAAAAAVAPAAAPQAAASKPVILPVGEEGSEEMKNSQMRKVIAKRLSESKFTAPHYYLTIEVDMANAAQSRVYINDLPDTKV